MISESDICTFVREVFSVQFRSIISGFMRPGTVTCVLYYLYFMSREFLTTEDVVSIFLLLLIKQDTAEIREMWILNMMEVDDDAERIFRQRKGIWGAGNVR
jgi:hypothetical protein